MMPSCSSVKSPFTSTSLVISGMHEQWSSGPFTSNNTLGSTLHETLTSRPFEPNAVPVSVERNTVGQTCSCRTQCHLNWLDSIRWADKSDDPFNFLPGAIWKSVLACGAIDSFAIQLIRTDVHSASSGMTFPNTLSFKT